MEYPAKVSPKLIAKLSVQAPPKLLVERYFIALPESFRKLINSTLFFFNHHLINQCIPSRYMIEISKSSGTPFTPDANIMREDEIAAAEQMLIDFKNQGGVCCL